ncbi:nucleoside-triphosphatase [Paenibacillus pinihumi]|uniref:nucleoside-triphosphatase n=1 Tax=Paenibacillus pinihumi TaxID=669462 RepID=UPI000567A560|nr:nucleoside-triphosphatase [Paenibacillus pinihumi]
MNERSKHVFLLTGEPRIGKSTMIKNLIYDIGSNHFVGFYTEEIPGASDRAGFRCVSIQGEGVELAHVDSTSTTRIGRYGVHIEAFETFALKALQSAVGSRKIIVIDEIGFMQMLSDSFQKKVQEIIAGHNVVVGTVPLNSHPAIDKLKHSQKVKLIEIDAFNRDRMSEILVTDILNLIDN